MFSGNAHLDGTGGASLDVKGGESVALNSLSLAEAIEPDSWDTWNSDRDQALTSGRCGDDAGERGAAQQRESSVERSEFERHLV